MKLLAGAARKIGFRSHRRFRLSVRGLALLLGLVGTYFFAYFLTLQKFDCAIGWYVVAASGAALEFIFADVMADRTFPYDTERKLELMTNRLGSAITETLADRLEDTISGFRGCALEKISATVHVVTDLMPTADHKVRRGLLQLTDYVGPAKGQKGRVTTISQGVVGRCARSGDVESVNFADEAEYLDRMVCEFGFSKEEAHRHTKKARSYLAVPMNMPGKTVGVIYFFSTEPQVFPIATSPDALHALAREFLSHLRHADLI